MNSPSYCGDEAYDDPAMLAALNKLDDFETSRFPSTSRSEVQRSPPIPPLSTNPESYDNDDIFEQAGPQDLQELDAAIEKDYRRKEAAAPASRSSSSNIFGPPLSRHQTTFFGTSYSPRSSPPKKPSSSLRGTPQRSPEHSTDRKVKKWDQFHDAVRPPPPMKLLPSLLEARHWIFPLNRPKRDYQFNISRTCLFDNTLVALPTGLGKTFIAGVVMLNFYRWFPEGKVVFVAPTKPLVAQQVEACSKTCGISGSDVIELTGDNNPTFRSKAWQEKRVFYMTPQTFQNDLATRNCDPRDIILLVLDEAHKGTGDHSYAKAVRLLMAENPHFRVLALTATPGSTLGAVQEIVDSLHISRIELRDEQSLDVRSYINVKTVKQHIIQMNEGIAKLRDPLAKVLDVYLKKCSNAGVLCGNLNPVTFHPYRAIAAMKQAKKSPACSALLDVNALARAMGYLLEFSPHMCFRSLTEGAEGASTLNKDPAFQTLMTELRLQKSNGFVVHPKFETLKMLVTDHFGRRLPDNDASTFRDDTRAIVFVTYRDAVDEIVDFLNQESSLLRATRFIGQGIDKKGEKGLTQQEQLDIISRFKEGIFNVLVATSVGEEGLDIGEVDLIVCYDTQKTPIRMVQRLGRTGRTREGYVHVLSAEGREENNWDKALDAYNNVQKSIDQLELYTDVERLLPDDIKPECRENVMKLEVYDRSATKRSHQTAACGPSKKCKNGDPA